MRVAAGISERMKRIRLETRCIGTREISWENGAASAGYFLLMSQCLVLFLLKMISIPYSLRSSVTELLDQNPRAVNREEWIVP